MLKQIEKIHSELDTLVASMIEAGTNNTPTFDKLHEAFVALDEALELAVQ